MRWAAQRTCLENAEECATGRCGRTLERRTPSVPRLYLLRDRGTERLSRSYPSVQGPSNPPAWKGSFEGSRDRELVQHLTSRSSASSGSSRFAMIPPCKSALYARKITRQTTDRVARFGSDWKGGRAPAGCTVSLGELIKHGCIFCT